MTLLRGVLGTVGAGVPNTATINSARWRKPTKLQSRKDRGKVCVYLEQVVFSSGQSQCSEISTPTVRAYFLYGPRFFLGPPVSFVVSFVASITSRFAAAIGTDCESDLL